MKISVQEKIQRLKETQLFRTLRPEEFEILALMMKDLIYEAGEVIINEGDEGDEAYVIYSGKVEVYRSVSGGIVKLNSLGPGELFGELALFGDGFRSASVKATEETIIGVIAKEKLYDIMREFPEVALEMLKVQTQRFYKAENRLMGFLDNEG